MFRFFFNRVFVRFSAMFVRQMTKYRWQCWRVLWVLFLWIFLPFLLLVFAISHNSTKFLTLGKTSQRKKPKREDEQEYRLQHFYYSYGECGWKFIKHNGVEFWVSSENYSYWQISFFFWLYQSSRIFLQYVWLKAFEYAGSGCVVNCSNIEYVCCTWDLKTYLLNFKLFGKIQDNDNISKFLFVTTDRNERTIYGA